MDFCSDLSNPEPYWKISVLFEDSWRILTSFWGYVWTRWMAVNGDITVSWKESKKMLYRTQLIRLRLVETNSVSVANLLPSTWFLRREICTNSYLFTKILLRNKMASNYFTSFNRYLNLYKFMHSFILHLSSQLNCFNNISPQSRQWISLRLTNNFTHVPNAFQS